MLLFHSEAAPQTATQLGMRRATPAKRELKILIHISQPKEKNCPLCTHSTLWRQCGCHNATLGWTQTINTELTPVQGAIPKPQGTRQWTYGMCQNHSGYTFNPDLSPGQTAGPSAAPHQGRVDPKMGSLPWTQYTTTCQA